MNKSYFVKIYFLRCHATMFEYGAFSHKIEYLKKKIGELLVQELRQFCLMSEFWILAAAGWTLTDPQYLQNAITPKPLELKSWTIERMFILHHMSQVTSHVSPVTCHLSCLNCPMTPFLILQNQLDKNGASLGRVWDQQGLPRLVFWASSLSIWRSLGSLEN